MIESISLFPSPDTPDLGCFVRRKHGLEVDDGFANIFVEVVPSIDFRPTYHQVYFRVMCGEAAFFQRSLVYRTADLQIPPPNLVAFPPDWILGGEYRPHPSNWYKYPTQSGTRFYWFIGQHRNPAGGSWRADALHGHAYDIYENGTLSTVHFDDSGGDRDLDDFVLQVAVVGRESWREVLEAANQEVANEQFAESGLPRLKAALEELGD